MLEADSVRVRAAAMVGGVCGIDALDNGVRINAEVSGRRHVRRTEVSRHRLGGIAFLRCFHRVDNDQLNGLDSTGSIVTCLNDWVVHKTPLSDAKRLRPAGSHLEDVY